MRRAATAAVLAGTVVSVLALTPMTSAYADWPAPVGSCPGSFVLQTLDPSDPGYDPDSPAHRDRNGDGWLCWNGHAWKDNNR